MRSLGRRRWGAENIRTRDKDLALELFSRRRWATGSAQQSNNCEIMPCICCIIFLGLTQTQQLLLGPIQPSSPTIKELHALAFCYFFGHHSFVITTTAQRYCTAKLILIVAVNIIKLINVFNRQETVWVTVCCDFWLQYYQFDGRKTD